jgi:uncharacterized protein
MIAWQDLFTALALVLVIEGLMPFARPAGMRRLFATLQALSDGQLRFAGATSMLLGLVLLYLVNR